LIDGLGDDCAHRRPQRVQFPLDGGERSGFDVGDHDAHALGGGA
jgi:hypothetical protein